MRWVDGWTDGRTDSGCVIWSRCAMSCCRPPLDLSLIRSCMCSSVWNRKAELLGSDSSHTWAATFPTARAWTWIAETSSRLPLYHSSLSTTIAGSGIRGRGLRGVARSSFSRSLTERVSRYPMVVVYQPTTLSRRHPHIAPACGRCNDTSEQPTFFVTVA